MPLKLSCKDTGPPWRHRLLPCSLKWDLGEELQDMVVELLSAFKQALGIIL